MNEIHADEQRARTTWIGALRTGRTTDERDEEKRTEGQPNVEQGVEWMNAGDYKMDELRGLG